MNTLRVIKYKKEKKEKKSRSNSIKKKIKIYNKNKKPKTSNERNTKDVGRSEANNVNKNKIIYMCIKYLLTRKGRTLLNSAIVVVLNHPSNHRHHHHHDGLKSKSQSWKCARESLESHIFYGIILDGVTVVFTHEESALNYITKSTFSEVDHNAHKYTPISSWILHRKADGDDALTVYESSTVSIQLHSYYWAVYANRRVATIRQRIFRKTVSWLFCLILIYTELHVSVGHPSTSTSSNKQRKKYWNELLWCLRLRPEGRNDKWIY